MRRAAILIFVTILAGVVLGGAVSVLAFYVARYGPSGGTWSFKGNGALVVYTAVPAVLAGGWTALVVHARGSRAWPILGLGAGLVGLVIAVAGAVVLPLSSAGDAANTLGSTIASIALVGWMLAAPVAAALIPLKGDGRSGVVSHAVAGVVWLIAAAAGVVVVGIVLPAGS